MLFDLFLLRYGCCAMRYASPDRLQHNVRRDDALAPMPAMLLFVFAL